MGGLFCWWVWNWVWTVAARRRRAGVHPPAQLCAVCAVDVAGARLAGESGTGQDGGGGGAVRAGLESGTGAARRRNGTSSKRGLSRQVS